MISELIRETPAEDRRDLADEVARLQEIVRALEGRVQQAEERRRAMLHIMSDLNESNRRLTDQRKAMLHILVDYENDRKRMARQTERLDNSRRALIHILQDSHQSNLRLADARKAMIHIMGDLRDTTEQIQRREHELREKQEQLVQAGKLATLGELTTGVAHELNNPLNNIGLYLGNLLDRLRLSERTALDAEAIASDAERALQQVGKATEIISHLRTFGRAAPLTREPVRVNRVVDAAVSLVQEQMRLRQIDVELHLCAGDAVVIGNAIQLEQIMINLLTNARDAVALARRKCIEIGTVVDGGMVVIAVTDTGTGIPPGLEQRIFDPFFTTKEVGKGTGLGLSITYAMVKEHEGSISVSNAEGRGASFVIRLPAIGTLEENDG
jgi:C4-dicarboxylate-specific signal transduction histidine kinase